MADRPEWMLSTRQREKLLETFGIMLTSYYDTIVDTACKAQARKLVKWGDEQCPHKWTEKVSGMEASFLVRKHACPICWEQLKWEVGRG